MGISQRTIQRWREQPEGGDDRREGPRTVPRNKLSEHEERRLLKKLNEPEFRDKSPRQVIPALAERGVYVGSEATAYRVLQRHGMQHHRERRRPPANTKPKELVARKPNQVFCWDITYLKGPIKGAFFYLYMVTDIYSRRIVAARVYEAESDDHSSELFARVKQQEGLAHGQVTLHSDNGGPMKGATIKATLEKLGVLTSYSRPRVSNDNPYAESLFGTMKGSSDYPKARFATIQDAQAWVDRFVLWYNCEHRHSALNWVTPMARHRGEDIKLLQQRRATYVAARRRNPTRWSGSIRNCDPAPAVTLNPSAMQPTKETAA